MRINTKGYPKKVAFCVLASYPKRVLLADFGAINFGHNRVFFGFSRIF